jgi:hypothetical protein
LEWHSTNFRQKKSFVLSSLSSITDLQAGTATTEDVRQTPCKSSRTSSPSVGTGYKSPLKEDIIAPNDKYLRLTNDQRTLDLHFSNLKLQAVFMEWLRDRYLKSKD